MFRIIKQEKEARRGVFSTVHGEIQTPAFMNVGTLAAIKGGLAAEDLNEIDCQVLLCNTYHLHLRPGDEIVRDMGGLQGFCNWHHPTLTDSGGFQVFSLAKFRKISESGVEFASHIDGRRIFMGPEESMQIQANLGSTIAMAFDECIENPAPREYVLRSVERTERWLERCKIHHDACMSQEIPNPSQLLFGINQGGTYDDIRAANMRRIAALDLDGYAIGGLAVGETAEEMYRIIEAVIPFMPKNKPRYLMGVGTPANIFEAVMRGVDLFDCVLPARNARHGHLFTKSGILNLNNQKYARDDRPIDAACDCPTCRMHSRAYLRHLLRCGEVLGLRLCVQHNLAFYNRMLSDIRVALDDGVFSTLYEEAREVYSSRI